MAINATAVWRVRISGSDTNGAGYDASISGAGTDYSQQDAAQLSLTDCTSTNSTTITSVTGGFTTAMIGNAIRLSAGTGVTTGYYFITARTDANTITVDRVSGTYTAGTGKVGGGAATWQRVANNASATGDKVVAGNIVYIRGAGTDTPASADYTFTGFTTTPSGDATSGVIAFIGENGRPRLQGNGLQFYNASSQRFENLYFATSSNANGNLGILHLSNGVVVNCVVDTNGQAAQVGVTLNSGYCVLADSEIKAGTTVLSASAGYPLVAAGAAYGSVIKGCYIHHGRDIGISTGAAAGLTISDNIIQGCVTQGILHNASATAGGYINNCTIDGNGSDGVKVLTASCLPYFFMTNCIISNNGGYGLNVASGTTAANNKFKTNVNYNCFPSGTNTSGAYSAISAGANDTTSDPQFANRTATPPDFSIGTNLKATGFPGLLRKTSTTSYVDLGAAQRQEQATRPPMLLLANSWAFIE